MPENTNSHSVCSYPQFQVVPGGWFRRGSGWFLHLPFATYPQKCKNREKLPCESGQGWEPCRCARWVVCPVGVVSRLAVARRGAREEFPKNLVHNVEKEHLQNNVLPGTELRTPLISGGRNLGTWRVTFLVIFLQGVSLTTGPDAIAAWQEISSAPCCAAAPLLRRRSAAARPIFPNLGCLRIPCEISHSLVITFANSGAQGIPAHLPQSGAPPCHPFRPFVFRHVRRTPGPPYNTKA
jgi:hypothetical protein